MRQALFLPVALLLLGCQRQPEPQLTQLQNRVQGQQDSLRQLRRQLGATQHLEDTLRQLRRQLGRTRQQLEETALAANALASPSLESAAPRRLRKPAQAGTLYGRPAIVRLADEDLAEVLSLADSTASSASEQFSAKAYRVCNGPADATLDYCNCSHYVYLALDSGDMPYEYKVFRLGPFYLARFAGWEKSEDDQDRLTLRIRHDVKGRPKTEAFRIGWDNVQRL